MSIQVTAGSGSLLAVGLGSGDIVTLYGLGRRVGNWLTAGPGDADLLNMLEEDEGSLLRRRGTIDITRFQTRWGKKLRLLENGRAQKVEGQIVERLLEETSRFTVSMTCIIAAIDEFASASGVRSIFSLLLRRLVGGTDLAVELLASQLDARINSWRSAAAVREMNVFCRKMRLELSRTGLIIDGFMHKDDAYEMADFLYWLLAGETDEMHTPSSDVAGVAYCLVHLSFESLDLVNFGLHQGRETPCRLIYQKAPIFLVPGGGSSSDTRRYTRKRELSTIVSLSQPEETFSTFPISPSLSNRCRSAWDNGAKAAKELELVVDVSPDAAKKPSLCYRINLLEAVEARRVDKKFYNLANSLSFFTSRTLVNGLTLALGSSQEDILHKIAEMIQIPDEGTYPQIPGPATESLTDGHMTRFFHNADAADAFSVLQAFFMGYYYDLFLRLVDTSSLEVKTVSGAWGYHSMDFLRAMYQFKTLPGPQNGSRTWARTSVLPVITSLCANRVVNIRHSPLGGTPREQETCVGVIGKRTILINSLLHDCESPEQVGRFVILDTDIGGIPRDSDGIIITGIPEALGIWDVPSPPPLIEPGLRVRGPKGDFTRHIEADWEGKAENLLLCIRYKGRRVGCVNPAAADVFFCTAFIPPAPSPLMDPFVPSCECTVDDFVHSGRLVTPSTAGPDVPVLVQTKGTKCMRYAAAAWYSEYGQVVLVGNCLHQSLDQAREMRKDETSRYLILIA